jgi:hypothetical protein
MTKQPQTTETPAPRSPETELWRSVFLQALRDANLPHSCVERRNARLWFTFAIEDVALVCELADLDPEAMREGIGALIQSWDMEDAPRRLRKAA